MALSHVNSKKVPMSPLLLRLDSIRLNESLSYQEEQSELANIIKIAMLTLV